MIRLRLGNIESLATFARMISVKLDCLKWLDTGKNNELGSFFSTKVWLRKKEEKDKNS